MASIEYKGFSLMDEGEKGSVPLTKNQVRMLQARDADCMQCSDQPWKIPVAFVGLMTFIALIVGSVAVDKINHMSDDDSGSSSGVTYCPYGDITWGDPVHFHEGHYYQIVGSSSGTLNWLEAQRDANSRCYNGHPGYLVNIGSQTENDYLYDLWQNHSAFTTDDLDMNAWIGATDMHEEGVFVWVGPGRMSIGVPFYSTSEGAIDGAYSYFSSGEPSETGEEDCVEMRNGHAKWNDKECYGENSFFFVEFGNPATAYLTDDDNPEE